MHIVKSLLAAFKLFLDTKCPVCLRIRKILLVSVALVFYLAFGPRFAFRLGLSLSELFAIMIIISCAILICIRLYFDKRAQ